MIGKKGAQTQGYVFAPYIMADSIQVNDFPLDTACYCKCVPPRPEGKEVGKWFEPNTEYMCLHITMLGRWVVELRIDEKPTQFYFDEAVFDECFGTDMRVYRIGTLL